jgi:predicted Zn-dependent protease
MEYKEFFKKAKEKNITNIQVTEKHNIEGLVELIDGEIDTFNESNNISYNIKAEINGKTYKVSTNYLDDEIIDLIIMKSKVTDTKYEDEYLEEREVIKKNKPINIDISNEIKKLKELSKLKDNYKEITKLTTYYVEFYTNTRIINSNGVDISTDTHQCEFYVDAVAKNKDDFTSYTKDILKTNKEDIDFELLIKDTMEKAIIESNKESLETKKYDIVLDSNTASNIIRHIISMISGESIRNKVSCL